MMMKLKINAPLVLIYLYIYVRKQIKKILHAKFSIIQKK